ncbi:MAG: DUF5667 domain-containing protein [Gammaproteobacteria bacterium]
MPPAKVSPSPASAVLALLLLCAGAAAEDGGPFADVAGLPPPGYVPSDFLYSFDRFGERLELLFAAAGDETVDLCLAFAREKLAEAGQMVHAGQAGFAWVAAGLYVDYVERGGAALADAPAVAAAARRSRFAGALLEHVYLLSRAYREMPLAVREVAARPIVNAALLEADAAFAAMDAAGRAAFHRRREHLRAAVAAMWEADAAGTGP